MLFINCKRGRPSHKRGGDPTYNNTNKALTSKKERTSSKEGENTNNLEPKLKRGRPRCSKNKPKNKVTEAEDPPPEIVETNLDEDEYVENERVTETESRLVENRIRKASEAARASSEDSLDEYDCNICRIVHDDCFSLFYKPTLNCPGCARLVHR